MDFHKGMLRKLIVDKCLMRGSFTLASGGRSNYYLDMKKVLLEPHGLKTLGHVLLDKAVGSWKNPFTAFDSIGGPAVGAIPLVVAFQLSDAYQGWWRFDKRAFYVLPKPKDHGWESYIHGNFRQGDRVILFEDVVTTGNSVIRTIQRVEQAGGHVIRVISVVDRLEGGQERLKDWNYTPIFTVKDLGV